MYNFQNSFSARVRWLLVLKKYNGIKEWFIILGKNKACFGGIVFLKWDKDNNSEVFVPCLLKFKQDS